MRTLLQDLRYSIRLLAKAPGFTVATVATLALAIGVNTAMFSLINTIVLAPLPFDNADRLVRVFRDSPDDDPFSAFSYPDYLEYRDRNEAFEELVVYSFMPASVETNEGAESVFGQIVTGNYFTTLGVSAQQGRLLTPEDDLTPGGHPVVVVSDRYWQRAMGGAPDAVGATLTMSGHAFTVVGVAPKGFAGAMPVPTPDLWMPMMMLEQIRPDWKGYLQERHHGFLWAMGRLKPEVTIEQAQASLNVMCAQFTDIDAERYENESVTLMPSDGVVPLTPGMRQTALAISTLVMAMVGLVLIVGCANVANLLLARATVRRREIGIRVAIGAPGHRILRQMLTESVLLALMGGAAGMLLAVLVMNLVAASIPALPFNIALDLNFGIDTRVLLFTGIVSMLAGVVFGIFPALGARKVDPVTAIKDDGGAGRFEFKRSRVRNTLVVAQVASSLVLLIVAGLFMRSLLQSNAMDPGFEHEQVLAVMYDIGTQGYDEAQSIEFSQQMLNRVRGLPGVEAAGIDDCPPLAMVMSSSPFWIEGRPYDHEDDETISTSRSVVSDGSFDALDIPLLRGRDFNERDMAVAPQVAIVNQAFVDRHWADADPIGKRISRAGVEGPFIEIVGVVATAKYRLPGEDPLPYVYLPITQIPVDSMATLLIRTSGAPETLIGPVRGVIHDLDPNMPLTNTTRLTDLIAFVLLPAKLAAVGFGMFGLLALLLATVGLYAVMSFTVSQRTREIGVRIALGARHGNVLGHVMKQGLRLTAIGVVIGLMFAWAGTRVLGSLLYQTSTADRVTFIGISLFLALIALIACYLPARRATRINPMVALRCE